MTDTPRSAIAVATEDDLLRARHAARMLARRGGLDEPAQVRMATIVSELGRNVLKYAGSGTCEFLLHQDYGQTRVCCVFRDRGPGIADVDAALADGYSTGGTLGVGLPGVRRLADRFHIETGAQGTVIVAEIHSRRPGPKGKSACRSKRTKR